MAKASRLNKKKSMYSTAVPPHHRPMKIAWRDCEYLTVHFIYSLCRRYCPSFIVIKIFSDERFIFLIITVQVQRQSGNTIIPYHQLVSLSTCQKTLANMTYNESQLCFFPTIKQYY